MWHHPEGQKKHTQDPCELVKLMKDIGKGLKPIRAIDVGCGDGIMAHEMLKYNKASHVTAFDISKSAIEAAKKNLKKFSDDERAQIFLKRAQSFFRNKKNRDRFELFAINPPFFSKGSGRRNKKDLDQTARHEGDLHLKEWVRGAKHLLRTGGECYCVFPTERLAELCAELVKNDLEPKEIWWLAADKRKRRFFLRAVRGASSGVLIHLNY